MQALTLSNREKSIFKLHIKQYMKKADLTHPDAIMLKNKVFEFIENL